MVRRCPCCYRSYSLRASSREGIENEQEENVCVYCGIPLQIDAHVGEGRRLIADRQVMTPKLSWM